MKRKIVTAGDRVYLKYFDLQFFHDKAREAEAELIAYKGFADGEFKAAIADADALVVIDRPIREDHLAVMEHCRIILALEVGYDFIDINGGANVGAAPTVNGEVFAAVAGVNGLAEICVVTIDLDTTACAVGDSWAVVMVTDTTPLLLSRLTLV